MIRSMLLVGEVWMRDLPPEYRPRQEITQWPSGLWIFAAIALVVMVLIWIRRRRLDPDRPDELTRELFVAHKFTSHQRREFMQRFRKHGWEHAADGFLNGSSCEVQMKRS